ncbi:phosphatase PAP2 family protein [Actinopolymorpha rutila]|uniref:phosphatase PAP2 family protein n=2 Tax=Actinopolymorpha rutila TaxID=446787 RepID=UPI00192D5BCA
MRTIGDVLARRVEAGHEIPSRWAETMRQLGSMDHALYETVARTTTPNLDVPVRRLSDAANYSRIWLVIATGVAIVGGKRGRRAALEGLLSIGVTSAVVNLGAKPLLRRRRPDRSRRDLFGARHTRMPTSATFPSGHAASAFAFAHTVGRTIPGLALPLGLLAGAVAYSRVHTGVHYPGDVVVGSIVGAGTAAMVTGALERERTRHGRR